MSRDAILVHSQKDMDRYYIQLEPEDLVPPLEKYTAWLVRNFRQTLDTMLSRNTSDGASY